jgi:5-methylthioadenosine/S-adenosylhomocysteine deaminase
MQPIDLLIEARWILPVEPARAIAHGAVAVDAGRLVAIGSAADLVARYRPREVVLRAHHALLPGFVPAHASLGAVLLRRLAPRAGRLRWLHEQAWPFERRWLSPGFVQAGARMALAELLCAGVTSVADRYYFPADTARVAGGLRVRLALGLPIGERPSPWAASADEHFAQAEALWDAYRGDAGVRCQFAALPSWGASRETLLRLRRLADQLDAPLALPLGDASTTDRPVEWLNDVGLLRPGTVCLVTRPLADTEATRIADSGAAVAWCEEVGVDAAAAFAASARAAHGEPALGLADPPWPLPLDLRATAARAALATGVSATTALRHATLGGARALGFGDATGSLVPGKSADLACIDIGSPACAAFVDPHEAVVFGGARAPVTDVWLAGHAAVRDGRLLVLDAAELADEAAAWHARLAVEVAA